MAKLIIILFFQTVKWCQYFKMLFIFIIMAWLRKWRFMKFDHTVIDCRHVCGCARRTDKTDGGETGPRAVSVRKSNAWCGGRGGTGLPPLSLVFEWVSIVRFKLCSSLTSGLCGARLHGQQQGQTTACGRCSRWWVTSSGCPWITSLKPLSHDGQWRVRQTWQSLEGDDPPFWKHDQPIGAGIPRSWLWC